MDLFSFFLFSLLPQKMQISLLFLFGICALDLLFLLFFIFVLDSLIRVLFPFILVLQFQFVIYYAFQFAPYSFQFVIYSLYHLIIIFYFRYFCVVNFFPCHVFPCLLTRSNFLIQFHALFVFFSRYCDIF
jgi:hypothetical protein